VRGHHNEEDVSAVGPDSEVPIEAILFGCGHAVLLPLRQPICPLFVVGFCVSSSVPLPCSSESEGAAQIHHGKDH
jgi:hypothetical protein